MEAIESRSGEVLVEWVRLEPREAVYGRHRVLPHVADDVSETACVHVVVHGTRRTPTLQVHVAGRISRSHAGPCAEVC